MRLLTAILFLFSGIQPLYSQAGTDTVRRIPAIGIQVKESDRVLLQAGLDSLTASIQLLRQKNDPFTKDNLADVLIYQKAVDYALRYQEFFSEKDIASAKMELVEGQTRAIQLLAGQAPWASQKGEVVRGYISRIDGSVQPYGLTIPPDYSKDKSWNLSLWFHGRGENMGEVNFLANTNSFVTSMPPMAHTIMLYPYGRYCNAFKFAGETDIWEALEATKKNYNIRKDGVIERGFSMGGAAAWQMAVHFPDQWLAANPGAGFAETYEFLQLYGQRLDPANYERKLWQLYDCTDYAGNLYYLPLIAYSGEVDQQIQAAKAMEKAMLAEGLQLHHVIGEKTAHSYHKGSALLVDSLLTVIAAVGKKPPPNEIHFTTYTLKYNKMYWITIDALKEHWVKARVDGKVMGNRVELTTTNLSGLRLDLQGLAHWIKPGKPFQISVDGAALTATPLSRKGSIVLHLEKGKWMLGLPKPRLVKKQGLQGPIDDAFMSSFIVVRPTGTSRNELFEKWSKSELDRFLIQWRRQFRGDAIVKDDTAITKADYSSNLILFGDMESNRLLGRLVSKLPIKWDPVAIRAGNVSYSSKTHGLVMIYPNPLHPQNYIVLNSGFTFREDAFLNNAKQIPMLPDWAIVDLRIPPGPVHPGGIESAGFFGEFWEWKGPVR